MKKHSEVNSMMGMRLLYFDTWQRSPWPVPFPGCVTVRVLHACTSGGQDHTRARFSKFGLLCQIFRTRGRMLKRAFRYLQAIGGRRTLAKVRSNVLEYQGLMFRAVAAVSGVVVETGGVEGVEVGSVVAGYRMGHPLYADCMLLHPEQMTKVPMQCSPEDAAVAFHYGMALEVFNRIQRDCKHLQTVVLCGDTTCCRLLEGFLRDERMPVNVFRKYTPSLLRSVKEGIKRGNPIVICGREWHRSLMRILPKDLTYLVGMNADDWSEDEWESLKGHWVGLPHSDVGNLNVFSRLTLDLPDYLNQRGLQKAVEDMVRRGWSSKTLLTKYDVSEAKEKDRLCLHKMYCLDAPSHEENRSLTVIKERRAISKTKSVLRVGFIGLGMWARGNLIPFLLGNPRVKIVMGADQDPVRLEQAVKLFSIPVVSSDPQEVISSEQIDAVFISTWHDSHAELASMAMRGGKKVFVEKPLALSHEQLRMVISALKEGTNSFLAVGYNRVHSSLTKLLKNELADEEGPITLTAIVREPTIPRTHYYYWPHQGPRIVTNGCHWIDYSFHLLGPRIPSDIQVIPSLGSEAEDSNVIIMRYADGSLVNLIFADRGESLIGGDEYIDIKCDGTQYMIHDFKTCTRYKEGRLRRIWESKADRGWEKELGDVVEGMLIGNPPRAHADIIASSSLVLEAKASYYNRGEVRRLPSSIFRIADLHSYE